MTDAVSPQSEILTNVCGRLDEAGATLHNVWYIARVWADMVEGRPAGTIKVDSEAMAHMVGFFAGELAAARASTEAAHRLVAELRMCV